MKILLTHSPEALANYYGERALAKLKEAGIPLPSSWEVARLL